MAIDRRREAAGGRPGRQPPLGEENGSLPPGDAAASVPLGSGAGPSSGGEIQSLPSPHPGGGPPSSGSAAAPSLLLLDYDGSVLPFLGGLGGGYQKTLVLLTWIPALFIGFSQFSDSFLLDQPNFWCREAGKGAELAGVTSTGRWGAYDGATWNSPPTTSFSTAAWGPAGNLSNSSGADRGDRPPLGSPPDKGDNASNCDCHAWNYGIRTGLVQNVVSKVALRRRDVSLQGLVSSVESRCCAEVWTVEIFLRGYYIKLSMCRKEVMAPLLSAKILKQVLFRAMPLVFK
ncbi:solute carrier family 22 member 23 isoform X16 [Eptesicus fuscus]|uniref:solute carrier family 22 member 23 isoform X16 n=1 Tax=Eptesicus fuscus TaxID=29078 RepID=UPI002404724D|nr:solute carrier family 22 member 23 isoform X16 [Eptesicus fuscus]